MPRRKGTVPRKCAYKAKEWAISEDEKEPPWLSSDEEEVVGKVRKWACPILPPSLVPFSEILLRNSEKVPIEEGAGVSAVDDVNDFEDIPPSSAEGEDAQGNSGGTPIETSEGTPIQTPDDTEEEESNVEPDLGGEWPPPTEPLHDR
jgi:hypothetical protein